MKPQKSPVLVVSAPAAIKIGSFEIKVISVKVLSCWLSFMSFNLTICDGCQNDKFVTQENLKE